jgi:hypothetical protein
MIPSLSRSGYNRGVPRAFLREGRKIVWHLGGVLGSRAIIAVCLLVSVTVVVGAWRSLWFGARGSLVDGVVVRQNEVLAADWDQRASRATGPTLATARRVFQAVLEFKVGDRLYQIAAKTSGPVLYPLGSTQTLVYPPGCPQEARLRSELPDIWSQAALLLMGTVVGSGALRWWWWVARRQRRLRRRQEGAPEAAKPATADEKTDEPT